MTRRWWLLAGGVVAVVVASCGGGSGNPGLTTFEGDGVTVSYPSQWKRQKDLEKDGELILLVFSPSANGAVSRVNVGVGPSTSSSAAQLAGITAENRVTELSGRTVAQRPANVPGASGGASRVVTDWELKGDDGQAVPAQAIDIVTRQGDREVVLTVSGPRASLRAPEIEKILHSLRLDD